jgi:hypothetical protein
MPTALSTSTTWENLQSDRTNLRSYGNRQYRYFIDDWIQLLDTVVGGEREVKEKATVYLPKTSGQKKNTTSGQDVYNAYKQRAVYYGYTQDTVIAMLGVMHAKPARIELPSVIAELDKDAVDPRAWRAGLQQILREINFDQLVYARCGLLVDMPAGEMPSSKATPKILQYETFFILDWGTRETEDGETILDYVLLAEPSEPEGGRRLSIGEQKTQFRILALDAAGNYFTTVVQEGTNERETTDALMAVDLDNPNPEDVVYPVANGRTLDFIPFVFVNATNLYPDIEKSAVIQLSNADLSIYRGDADWAQAFFLQGQATPVISGVQKVSDELLFGAGGFIHIPDAEGKAYYMEVKGEGMNEMRQRQLILQKYAVSLGVSLLDNKQPESGIALQTRVGIKSAPLSVIAETAAKGLLQALRYAHYWKTGDMGVDSITLEPNKDFTSAQKATRELLDLWTAKLSGAPISVKDVHKFARDNNFSTQPFEKTLEDIEEEDINSMLTQTEESGGSDDPENNVQQSV